MQQKLKKMKQKLKENRKMKKQLTRQMESKLIGYASHYNGNPDFLKVGVPKPSVFPSGIADLGLIYYTLVLRCTAHHNRIDETIMALLTTLKRLQEAVSEHHQDIINGQETETIIFLNRNERLKSHLAGKNFECVILLRWKKDFCKKLHSIDGYHFNKK